MLSFYIGVGFVFLYHYCIKPPILKCSYSIGNSLQDCSDFSTNCRTNCRTILKITYNNLYMCFTFFIFKSYTYKNKKCSICLCDNNKISHTLSCNHTYHTKQSKLNNLNVSCPIRRTKYCINNFSFNF